MKYVSSIHALNIENSLNTCGDWHCSALKWEDIELRESTNSIFEDYGIEKEKQIPEHNVAYNVANDIRAILDMLEANKLGFLKGFYEDFICTDEYNREFFDMVYKLRCKPHWDDINKLMKKEFMYKWDEYIKEKYSEQLERDTL